ncbi:MAG: hypothetical protein FD155_413 [Bacteroidetes bacterium]|nr:MAG: hypothetical protein FD155_413 [Bacteroidota bacterium]
MLTNKLQVADCQAKGKNLVLKKLVWRFLQLYQLFP